MIAEGALMLGLLMGVRHALEADHVAAIATISSDSQSPLSATLYGVVWAVGHTLIIIVFSLLISFFGKSYIEPLSHSAELVVAIMLMLMGGNVLYRMHKERVHFHTHQHEDQTVHFHAHSHKDKDERQHSRSSHNHRHRQLGLQALIIGVIHGLAGSAVLFIAMGAAISDFSNQLLFLLLFGLGSAIGMAVLSLVISVPFRMGAASMTNFYRALRIALGVISMGIGAHLFIGTV